MESAIVIKTAISTFLLIFLPGLCLSMGLFPRKKQLDVVERIGISFILGLTSALLIYFLDKNLEMAFNESTSTLAYSLIAVTGLSLWRIRGGESLFK